MIDTKKLREAAEAVKGWSNCDQAWIEGQDSGVAAVGSVMDDERYPVTTVDTGLYFQDKDAIKLAGFYAAANPQTIIAILDELDRVTAERDALKGDAERYRWLRDKANYIRFDAPQVCITDWKGQIASTLASAYPSGEDLDNAIDAIRASKVTDDA